MGLETAALVMVGVAAAAETGKAISEVASAKQKEQALELNAKEMKLQAQQKTLANYDKVQSVLEAQEAAMTVRGVAFSSPSFNAIQRATLNIASKEQKNIDTEAAITQANIELEKQNVRTTLFAQLFGDVAATASAAAGVYAKAPKKLPAMEDE